MAEDLNTPDNSGASRCVNHPEREAAGVCRACGRYICAECATKVQGINFCVSCLKLFEGQQPEQESGSVEISKLQKLGALLIYIFVVSLAMGAAYGIPAWRTSMGTDEEEQPEKLAKGQVKILGWSLNRFRSDVGRYPTLEEGFKALWDDDPLGSGESISGWDGPYGYLEEGDFFEEETGILYAQGYEIHYDLAREGKECHYYLSCPGENGRWDTPEIDELDPDSTAYGDDFIFWLKSSECEEP